MLVENNNSEKNSTDKVLDIYPIQLASRFKRWCVAFIDNLMGYFFVFAGVRLFSIGENAELGLLIGLVLYIALQLYFMKTYRQTLGKYWLNIRVLDYATNQPVSFGKYVVREILDFILNLTGLILISVIVVFVSRERRSLTDAIMSTIVVKTL